MGGKTSGQQPAPNLPQISTIGDQPHLIQFRPDVGVVGRESIVADSSIGILDIALFIGGNTTLNRTVIQSVGNAFKMTAKDLIEEFTLGGVFHNMLRYTQALITQISQTAVCNRLHSVEQQLCRWLLLSHDRLDSDKLVMTHNLISDMLGVRREGVTLATHKLSKKNLVTNIRGTISIIDSLGLEREVCDCYKVVNYEYNRLLGRGMSLTFP